MTRFGKCESPQIGTYRITAQEVALPIITTQPVSTTRVEGQSATFQVVATSVAPLSYQWLRDGVEISGARDQSYQVTALRGLDTSVFQARVTNVAGNSISDPATLRVTNAPTLSLGQIFEASINPVGDVDWYNITITEVGGYQALVTGSAGGGHTLPYPSVMIRDQSGVVVAYSQSENGKASAFASLTPGTYTISVSSYYTGYAGTYSVSMVPVLLPTITAQPTSLTITEGRNAKFFVTASSVAPLTYRWFQNDRAIGFSTSEYSVPINDTTQDGSIFRVQVSNVAGGVTSDPATLRIVAAPTLLLSQTTEGNLTIPNSGADWYRFTITEAGSYQVRVNGFEIDSHTLRYPYVRILDSNKTEIASGSDYRNASAFATLNPGTYIAAVTASYSNYTGTYAISLQRVLAPAITTQPQALFITEGQTATFRVTATSTAPLTYQWYRGGIALPGQTGDSYTTANVSTSLNGSIYTAQVRNLAGTVTSEPAVLTVSVAPSLAVGQTIAAGIDPVGDVDWYRTSITEPGGYRVDVAGMGTDSTRWTLQNPSVRLLDNASNLIAQDDDSGPAQDASLSLRLTSGTYLVAVRSGSPNSIGTYAVSLTQFQPPTITTHPGNVAIIVGQSASFGVDIVSDGNVSFQWTRNGMNIFGANSRTYTVTANDATLDGSQYRVVVKNEAGEVTSNPATLTVSTGIEQNISGFGPFAASTYGDPALSLAGVAGGASGNPVVFTSSDSSIAAVTGPILTILRAGTTTITANQAGNAQYMPAIPVSQTLVVERALQAITFADLGTIAYGIPSVTLSASASSGLPVTFAIVQGPASLSGRTLTLSEAGEVIVAANQSGDANRQAAPEIRRTLTVTATAPQFTSQPVGGEIAVGGSLSLSATIGNPFGATFQWYAGDAPILNATDSRYVATAPDSAAVAYRLIVTNRYGSTTSDVVQVVGVQVPVRIVTQPSSASVLAGTSASFTVAVQGSQPLSYQWLRNGLAIPGATNASLLIAAPTFADDGAVIQVDVTNPLGTVRSAEALVRVYGPPFVMVAPTDITRYEGSSATFTVSASSLGPIAYQWYRDGQPVASAVASNYTVPTITSGDEGAVFTVVLTNSAGSTTAGPVVLHVLPRQAQVISGFAAIAPMTLGTPDVTLRNVTGGGSGNPVSFSSSNSSVAMVINDAIRAVGVGTARITASQEGIALYAPAIPVTQDVTVVSGTQTITFASIRAQPFGTPPFRVTASASSGLPVTLTVIDGPGIFAEDQLVLTGIGTVTITASQTGNANYQAAAAVTRTVEVTPAAPIIVKQPSAITAPVGASCRLEVGISNSRYATYQWFRGGIPIPGATDSAYVAIAPALGITDVYRVESTNIAGTTVSADATVQGMLSYPTITRQPQSTAVYRGGTAVFNVAVQGSSPLAVQWFRNNEPVPGATAATWSFAGVTDEVDRSQIRVTVSNPAGTTSSEAVTLRVHAAPLITIQPANVNVELGMRAVFTATVDSSLPVTYQWTRGGFPIPGATSASYVFNTTTSGDDGAVLRLMATNELGTVNSDPAMLRVSIVPPVITQQPTSVVLTDIGGQANFLVEVRSGLPVTYQWFRNGVALLGATTAHYSLVPTEADIGALFTVVISNDLGSVTSANATVTRVAKPVITQQPTAQTVALGARVIFDVAARSFDPARTLSFQWRRNGVDIPDAVSSRLVLASVVMSDDGAQYSVLVSDGPAAQVSQSALLRVTTAPVVITTQSNSQVVDPGTPITFTVSTSGTFPIGFQWYRNGQAITGATLNSYTTPPVTDADYGSVFHVEASNPFGTARSEDMLILGEPRIIGTFTNPVPFGLTVGDSGSLRATVRGRRPIGFRWYRNEVLIPDATSDTFILPQVSSSDNGVYMVTAWNSDAEVSAYVGTLVVYDGPPVITVQPQDRNVSLGQSTQFGVRTEIGGPATTFQWYRNGIAIDGEIQSQLIWDRVTESDSTALFHVVVTNRFGSVTSRDARVSILSPLAIVTQPRSVTVNAGESAVFSVVVNTGSITYTWRRNGTEFGARNQSSLIIENASISDNGAVFDVVVQRSGGEQVVSDAVTLTVIDNPPVITVQPVDVRATLGQNALFGVTVTGSQPMHFRWTRDGVVIEDQDAPTLSVPILSLADDGAIFQVEVSNLRGRVTSTTARLAVEFVPGTVVTEPDVVAEIHGDSVLIHPNALVSNGDRTGISYQWTQISGTSLPQLPTILSSSARLLLTGLKPGAYVVRCSAVYAGISSTQHDFRFNFTRSLAWITSPRMVGSVSESLTARLAAVAGFGGTEDPATRYQWRQVAGPSGAIFAANGSPAAQENQLQLPERGCYTIACTAEWRDAKITRQFVIDTEAETDADGLLGTLSGRTLLIAATAFDAARWQSDSDYRMTYLAGVEPGRVWQSPPPGNGLSALRSSDRFYRHAAAGSTLTLRVRTPAGAPVSWATLHGGSFISNRLNAITVLASDAGEASVDIQVPSQAGTYLILAASPLDVGRQSFTVVVP